MERTINGYNLTDEMNNFIDLAIEGEDVKGYAFAGAGKTSSLVAVEKYVKKKGLYLVFNKALEMDARKAFNGDRIEISTGHSFALRQMSKEEKNGFLYMPGTKKSRLRKITEKEFVKFAGIDIHGRHEKLINIVKKRRMVTSCVDAFYASASIELSDIHLSNDARDYVAELFSDKKIKQSEVKEIHALIIEYAKNLAKEQLSINSDCPTSHDAYFKYFANKSSQLEFDYDFILYDEVQDANPVMLNFILKQQCQKLYVGDPNQSINSFRYSINAFDLIPAKTVCFSHSFRYGEKLGNLATKILAHKSPNLRIKGVGFDTEIHKASEFKGNDEQLLYIAHNNQNLFEAFVLSFEGGVQAKYCSPGKSKYLAMDLESLISLSENGVAKSDKHKNYKNIRAVVLEAKDATLKKMAELVDERIGFAKKLLVNLKLADNIQSDKAGILLSTAHGSKGLEADNVMLGDDFISIVNSFSKGKDLPEQDLYLIYVAITRAKKNLVLSDNLHRALIEDNLAFKLVKHKVPAFLSDNLIPNPVTQDKEGNDSANEKKTKKNNSDSNGRKRSLPELRVTPEVVNDSSHATSSFDSEEKMNYPPIQQEGEQVKIAIGKQKVDNWEQVSINDLPFNFWQPNDTSKFINPSLGVVGKPGSGKTQNIKSILSQLHLQRHLNTNQDKIGTLIIDYKKDYMDKQFVQLTNARVLKSDLLPINPLAIFDHENDKSLINNAGLFTDTLARTFNLGVTQQQKLRSCIMEAYERRGISKGQISSFKKRPPTIQDVMTIYFEQDKIAKDSLYAALSELRDYDVFESNPAKCKPLFDLLDGGVLVLDVNGSIPESLQSLLVAVVIDQFYAQMVTAGKPKPIGNLRPLRTMLLVDEAVNFMSKGYISFNKILKEGREFGVGVILSTQNISDFMMVKDADYSKQMCAWLVHAVSNPSSNETKVVTGLHQSKDVNQIKEAFSKLKPHHAYFICNQLKKPITHQESTAVWRLYEWLDEIKS